MNILVIFNVNPQVNRTTPAFPFWRAGCQAGQTRPDQAHTRCLQMTEDEHKFRIETMEIEKKAWMEGWRD